MSDERRVWIKLISQRNGSRYDNREWPTPGEPFSVPEWEGEALTRIKEAVYTSDEEAANLSQPKVDSEVVPLDEPIEREYHGGQPVSSPKVSADVEPVVEENVEEPTEEVVAEEDTADEAVEEVTKPAPYASKADWVTYAVSQGHDADDASSLTKADLQSRYGGRL
jgi:hypothetical protein